MADFPTRRALNYGADHPIGWSERIRAYRDPGYLTNRSKSRVESARISRGQHVNDVRLEKFTHPLFSVYVYTGLMAHSLKAVP